MKSVRILSHTADIRLLVNANSRHELFSAGILGLNKMMSPGTRKKKYLYHREIRIEAPDLTSLFIDFLNEVLSYNHIDKCIYDKIVDLNLEENHVLSVKMEGFPVKKFNKDIKAVTYHEAEIKQSGAGIYQTMIILDI